MHDGTATGTQSPDPVAPKCDRCGRPVEFVPSSGTGTVLCADCFRDNAKQAGVGSAGSERVRRKRLSLGRLAVFTFVGFASVFFLVAVSMNVLTWLNQPPGKVEGVISQGFSDRPLDGIDVYLARVVAGPAVVGAALLPIGSTKSDGRGRYRFEGLDEGVYWLMASKNFDTRAQVPCDASETDISQSGVHRLVKDPDGTFRLEVIIDRIPVLDSVSRVNVDFRC
jgi:hypothetical protein